MGRGFVQVGRGYVFYALVSSVICKLDLIDFA